MTGNQIAYQVMLETRRANLAREGENYRSNVAKEQENYRHDVATEQENQRHAKETERLGLLNFGETVRNNQAIETIRIQELNEKQRNNLATEAENHRANLRREMENERSNKVKEAENERSNREKEQLQWDALALDRYRTINDIRQRSQEIDIKKQDANTKLRDSNLRYIEVAKSGMEFLLNKGQQTGSTMAEALYSIFM